MKLKRIVALPFALLADVVTIGNFGDRMYTQQVFDAERREQKIKEDVEAIKVLAELLRALK